MLEYNRRKKYPLTLYRSLATTADIVWLMNFSSLELSLLNYKLSPIFFLPYISKLPPLFSLVADIFSAYHGTIIEYVHTYGRYRCIEYRLFADITYLEFRTMTIMMHVAWKTHLEASFCILCVSLIKLPCVFYVILYFVPKLFCFIKYTQEGDVERLLILEEEVKKVNLLKNV